jgi:predicted nucleic acid-binding protein
MAVLSILVTDTNIWIDLENGGILVDVFQLPYRFLIPNFATTELIRPSWETMVILGLEVHELIAEQVLELVKLKQEYRTLSIIDLSAFLLAISLDATLLTGEFQLTKLANTYRLPVHGVLWLLDEIVRLQVLTPVQVAFALRRMLVQGARLPKEESNERLDHWLE